ncbi:hypothetical protein [Methanoculleus sp. 7T]|uniref:hypothetical protein n=1 Tax=Methanoculleus sp. 7T TaxID=2937282 RepID=UPI0020BDE131|nr:hypothetical protein [Methanoculleus sp. 7T]MCK8518084.1 hypothetical protein [Methanoculleus sp. 7T]
MKPKFLSGIGALFVALLLVGAVIVPTVSAESTVTPLATEDLGDMHADGETDSVWISGVDTGSVQVPAGWNTFTVNCQNENDGLGDGQGAYFELTVWDARGGKYTDVWDTSVAGSKTLSVSFDSQGTGDAQYELYCQTDWMGTIKDEAKYTGDLDFI